MKFSITDFFSKYDQIRRKLRIWSHLLKKSAMENFIFCAVSTQVFLLLDFAMCMYNLHAWSQEKYFLAQFNLTRGYGYIPPFPSFFNATLARPVETPGKLWLLFKNFPSFFYQYRAKLKLLLCNSGFPVKFLLNIKRIWTNWLASIPTESVRFSGYFIGTKLICLNWLNIMPLVPSVHKKVIHTLTNPATLSCRFF